MKLPLALQPLRCIRPDCTLPQSGRCAREAEFPDPVTLCPELARELQAPDLPAKVASVPPTPPEASTAPIGSQDDEPWRGRHLNASEATALLQRSPARLIAVLGAHDAGKTCLLASFFLQLANGQRGSLPYRFASSLSLFGWRDFVERARLWEGEAHREIVGHTPRNDEPDAGHFLHLGLRPENSDDERHIDFLFTDLPGEWIGEWGVSKNPTTQRRLPFLQRADGFIVVVDASALLSEEGLKLDSRTALLVRRIAEAPPRNRRPGLALVLSKLDLVLDHFPRPPSAGDDLQRWGPIAKRLRQTGPALNTAKSRGFEVRIFGTSAFPVALDVGQPVNVVSPFAHVIERADLRERWPRLVVPVPPDASCFQSMRRWEDLS